MKNYLKNKFNLNDNKPIGFYFYIYIFLKLILFVMFYTYTAPMESSIIGIGFHPLAYFYLILYFSLIIGLLLRNDIFYKINFFVLFNECWNTPLTNYGVLLDHSIRKYTLIDDSYYDFDIFILQFLIFLTIWFMPNYVYFKKRRRSFTSNISAKDDPISEIDNIQNIKLNDSANDKSDFKDRVRALKKRPKVNDSKNVLNENKKSSEDVLEKI